MKYLMFEHAGSDNHGCEAIVRTTCNILGKHDYYLQTLNTQSDIKFGIDKLAKLIELDDKNLKRNSINGILTRIKAHVKSVDYDVLESVYRNKRLMIKNSVVLSIGGDNYSYNGIIGSMRDKLKAFKYKNIPVCLWGCSVDTNHLDKNVISDLRSYDLITARESLTIQNLFDVGVRDSVIACSDPAFTLGRQKVEWNYDILATGNVIGLNVSDFMKYYNAYPDATYKNFKKLIEYILKETDYYLAMIPHVRAEGNDDLIPIKMLAEEVNNPRVLVVEEDYNCMQLKDIIARCKMFIGCRTHSTIAAYSTCVPTLVVGYSVKARGIAKDIFGETDDLLVDVREFNNDDDLVKKFIAFSERENEIRNRLNTFMPEYINRAYNAKEAIKTIIKGNK